jgi:hypothetical protein
VCIQAILGPLQGYQSVREPLWVYWSCGDFFTVNLFLCIFSFSHFLMGFLVNLENAETFIKWTLDTDCSTHAWQVIFPKAWTVWFCQYYVGKCWCKCFLILPIWTEYWICYSSEISWATCKELLVITTDSCQGLTALHELFKGFTLEI